MAKRWMGLLVRCFDGDNPGCDDQTSFNSGAKPGDRSPVMDSDHNTVRLSRLGLLSLMRLTFTIFAYRRNPLWEEKVACTGANSIINVVH
jgi:hypothetical protein